MDRDNSLIKEIDKLGKDIVDYKSSQLIGKDSVKPKIVERLNSDGSPTQWDIYGAVNPYSGSGWMFEAKVKYIAKNQKEPYALMYMKLQTKPGGSGVSAFGGANAFIDLTTLDDVGSLTFNVYGSDDTFYDPAVDRIWVKFYAYATDYGTLEITPTIGTLVPLT